MKNPIKEKESDIVRTILEYLQLKKIVCWRNQSGMIFSEYKGKSRAIRMGVKGVSDIIAIYPNGSGRLWAIEVKANKNKPSPVPITRSKRTFPLGNILR